MKYNTVIFDMDGTLLNTLEDLGDSVNFALRHFDMPEITYAQAASYIGNGVARLVALSMEGGTENPHYEEALAIFVEHYSQHCRDKTKPYDGMLELLAKLKEQGYKTAVVSNKFDDAVKELAEFHFAGLLPVAIGETKEIRRKPAPDTVIQALKELDSTVEESVYVGDSEVDILTAKNANMDCISITWGFRSREELVESGATVLADTMDELMQLLKD